MSFWRVFLSSRLNALLIVISLLVGGVMMLVVLVKYLGYRQEIRKLAQSQTGPPADISASAGSETNAVPSDLSARIDAWRQLPETLMALDSLQQKKQLEQAEAGFKSALEGNPTAVPLHLGLARLLADIGRPAEAVEHLAAALNAQPADLEARLLLARMLERLNEHGLSLKVAEWMIEVDPYSPEAHRIAADSFLKTGQPRAAISHLRKIANLELDNLQVKAELANTYSLAGDHQKAVDLLEGVLQQDLVNAPAYFALAVCYTRQSMTNEALKVLDRAAVNLGPNSVREWMDKPELEAIRKPPVTDPSASPETAEEAAGSAGP